MREKLLLTSSLARAIGLRLQGTENRPSVLRSSIVPHLRLLRPRLSGDGFHLGLAFTGSSEEKQAVWALRRESQPEQAILRRKSGPGPRSRSRKDVESGILTSQLRTPPRPK